MIIADYDKGAADAFLAMLNHSNVRAQHVDVFDRKVLIQLMDEAALVANGTGPCCNLLVPVADALMASTCKNYVDLYDEVEVFDEVLTP